MTLRSHRLRNQRGIALPMALGFMLVISIALVTVLEMSSSSERSSERSQASNGAYALAEAGLNEAFSVLAAASDPTNPAALPPSGSPAVQSLEGGTVRYWASYTGNVWTINSTGTLANPTGAAVDVSRSLTQTVTVVTVPSGSPLSMWDRVYLHKASPCITISRSIPGPFAARGCIVLSSSAKLTGQTVAIGTTLTINAGSSVGTSSVNRIQKADTGSWCKYATQASYGPPCRGGPGYEDKVYADTVTANPENLAMPIVDFPNWYANAKPGPQNNCTGADRSGPVPNFDLDSVYDGETFTADLTPGSSYVCRVRDGSGTVIGELSWNLATLVLTIKGVIFFDGNIDFSTSSPVHYQGQGTIFAARRMIEANATQIICAGGSGATSCRTTISSWDPSTNLLTLILGDKETSGRDFAIDESSAFQGAVWAKNGCWFEDTAYMSGPFSCYDLITADSPVFYTWPSLSSVPVGTGGPTTYQLQPGNQLG